LIQSSGGPGTVGASGPQGCQMVTANAVGGGSNLYLAASIRSPSETFERRDHNPDDGPDRRMWPKQISRKSLNPFYARAERGLRVNRPGWNRVSKSGGLWAATLHAAGHTCDRVPVAIDPGRCVEAKWCHTGCIFGAKNTLNTNYLASAERMGVRVRPNRQVESVRRSQANASGYRYVVTADVMDNLGPSPSRAPTGESEEIECKVLVMAAGAMGNSPILMRSRQDLPSLSERLGMHLGSNGDHVAAIEYSPRKVRDLLGLPGYGQFYKGKPITTLTYDFWVGRRAHRFDGSRFTLQEIFLSSLTNFLYDDGREPDGEPSWWGAQKKRAISAWSNRIELLAMVEDTHDGTFLSPPPQGGAVQPNAGPVRVGLFSYDVSEQSVRVRELADRAMRQIAERDGLGRFMRLTESRGVYCAHPLGGCRMAASKDLGVVDHRCEAFDNEGLLCVDSSAIPSSLGVNPSLTIAAVSERAAAHLTARAHDLGLPRRPPGFRHRTPGLHVGERVTPRRSRSAV
ncbi:MAG TPA: GMC oxidoreductase, partial [Thermoleophilaceae bacterium]